MARRPIPLRPIAGAVAALSAAPVAIAGVLALTGELGWLAALAIAVGTVAAVTPLVVGHQRGLARIAGYAGSALGRGEALSGPQPAGTLAEVAAAVGGLARGAAEQQRRADHAARANAVIIENLPEPLLLLGPDGAVLGANIAARAAFGSRLADHDLSAVIRAPALLDAIAAVLAGEAKREVEFDQPVPVARSFNAIVERLPSVADPGPAVRQEPRPVAMVLIHDLTALKRTEQLRAEFVANVSHELRTPLSALIGFIETLAGAARNDPAARERFLGLMEEQGRRMTRLIDDLLSLSRIELEEHTRPSDAVDLSARVRAVIQALGQRAAQRGIALKLEQSDPDCQVIGESDQIYEVIENLVENAIRYSRDHSAVTVRLWRLSDRAGDDAAGEDAARGGTVAMAVQDQGEGIAREHIPRITERFYRVDRARSRAMGGTGLGLAIVKHIVSRHRATLQIESRVGEGSTFTVYWPAAPRPVRSGEPRLSALTL
ncbi:MAG: ATP-binding protein [Alphaproteobacteria bacterium]